MSSEQREKTGSSRGAHLERPNHLSMQELTSSPLAGMGFADGQTAVAHKHMILPGVNAPVVMNCRHGGFLAWLRQKTGLLLSMSGQGDQGKQENVGQCEGRYAISLYWVLNQRQVVIKHRNDLPVVLLYDVLGALGQVLS